MECPVCKEAMLIIEYQEVQVDYCDACQGIWLDAGELDLLFGDHTLTEGFMTAGNPATAKNEALLNCPLCDSTMLKAVTGGAQPVVHDYCPKGHGIWFDKGELRTVLEQGSETGSVSPAVQWLRDLFPAPSEHRR